VIFDSKFFNSPEIDGASPAVRTVNLIIFRKKKLGKISAVLPGNAGDYCSLHEFSCSLADNFILLPPVSPQRPPRSDIPKATNGLPFPRQLFSLAQLRVRATWRYLGSFKDGREIAKSTAAGDRYSMS